MKFIQILIEMQKLTKKKRVEYERYLKSLHSEASWNETQRFKAEREQRLLKEAAEKAREEEKLQIAESLIKNGASIELVALSTQLSKEVVTELKQKIDAEI